MNQRAKELSEEREERKGASPKQARESKLASHTSEGKRRQSSSRSIEKRVEWKYRSDSKSKKNSVMEYYIDGMVIVSVFWRRAAEPCRDCRGG